MRIDVYAMGFSVSDLGPKAKECALRLCRYVGQYEFRRNRDGFSEKVWVGCYAGGTKDRQLFVFHKAYLQKFLNLLDETGTTNYELIEHPLYIPKRVGLELIDHRPPYQYQIDAVRMINKPIDDPVRRMLDAKITVVTLGPGEGKTFVAIRAAVERGELVVLVLRAQYVDKWIDDVQKAINIKPEECTVVRGSAVLMDVMQRAVYNEIREKVILISNATYRNYMTEYELHGEAVRRMGYMLTPFEFFPALGAGMLGVDEFHQDFHFNLRLMIYSHVPVFFALTGTLEPDDQFKREVVNTVVPHDVRFVGPPPKPYLRMSALLYNVERAGKLRWTNRGRTDYSQGAFERSIMKEKRLLKNYLTMIASICTDVFMPGYRKGKRYLVFAASKAMCTYITEKLREEFKHMPELKILRYIGEDPYSHVEQFDILVSTLKSAGTALDMPGLEKVLMTDAVNDSQQNKQVAKRVRDPAKIPGTEDYDPEFVYLVCNAVPQHHRYHQRKVEIFEGTLTGHQLYNTDYVI